MDTEDAAPNQLSRRDAAALIGIVVVLEGEVLAGEIGADLLRELARRLWDQGHMRPHLDDRSGLRLALNDLNQRVRYALGEYDELPEPDAGLVHHFVGFEAESDARTFRQAPSPSSSALVPHGSGGLYLAARTQDL